MPKLIKILNIKRAFLSYFYKNCTHSTGMSALIIFKIYLNIFFGYDQCMLYNVFKITESYTQKLNIQNKEEEGDVSQKILAEFHSLMVGFRQKIFKITIFLYLYI